MLDRLRPLRLLLQVACCMVAVGIAVSVRPSVTAPVKHVRPFLIYYGGLPDARTNASAQALANEFRGYPVVIFGASWLAPHFADLVRRDLPTTQLYGYADTGQVSMGHVLGRLRLLGRMRFSGVLLDEAGTALSASTARLQAIIDAAHADHLAVLVNAWDLQRVLPLHLRPVTDAVLLENWVFSEGHWQDRRSVATYAALRILQGRRIAAFMIVTMARAPVVPEQAVLPIEQTVLWEYGNDVSVSGPNYSATTDAIFPAARLKTTLAEIPS